MSRLRIDVGVLDAMVEEMTALHDDLDAALKTVRSLAGDVRDSWSGAAAEAFEASTSLWVQEAEESIAELDRLKATALTTSNNWAKAFDADAKMWE